MKTPNPKLITAHIMTELLEHKDCTDTPQLYLNRERKLITYLSDSPTPNQHEPITETEAKGIITNWVNEELERIGKVYLYTCRDNAEICIETIELDEVNDPESEANTCFGTDQDSETPIGLLIGYD